MGKAVPKVAGYVLLLSLLWSLAASIALIVLAGLYRHLDRVPEWSLPFQWFLYGHAYYGRPGVAHDLGVSAAIACALCVAAAVSSYTQPKKKLFGESHFATDDEAKKSGLIFSRQPLGDAFLLGRTHGVLGLGRRYVSLPGQEHVSLYARTRSGKGVSVVVPNALNWGGSLVAFSIKRDLVQAAAAERIRKKQSVFVFDPTNPDGRSHRWNPLGNVPRGGVGCYDAVQRVMQFVIPETKANNPFWDNAGRRIATAAAVLLAETPGAALNIASVKRLLGRSDYDKHFRQMIKEARDEARPYSASAVDTILGWLDRKGEEGANGVRDTALTAMALWDSEVIAAATEVSDFDVAALRREPMSVFVCAEVADIRRLRPLFALFFQQLVDFNTRREFAEDPRHRYQVAVEMDEFWAPGRMDILADAAAFTASFGFRLLYVVQSKQQLHSIYGQDGAENIFLNTGAELLFGGADQQLAEEVSKRGGTDTVTKTTTSRPRFFGWLTPAKQSESDAEHGRALLLAQDVQRIPRDEMLVLRPGLPPLKLSRVVWFKDAFFRRMGGEAPPVPRLHLRVERDDFKAVAKAQAESQAQHDRAKKEEEARAEAEFAEAEKAAAEAAVQVKSADEVERITEAEVLVRVREAAVAQEAARQARQAAAEAKRDAKAREDAACATVEATAAASTAAVIAAAEAQQAVANAKADLSLARRDAIARRKRAEHLGRVLHKLRS